MNREDRYALVFFILNTLNFIQGGGYCCYCDNMVKEENGIKSRPRWKSGNYQICIIPYIFDDFENLVDRNCFYVSALCKYYEQLFNELVNLFDQCPQTNDCFLEREYVCGGCDWDSGEMSEHLMVFSFRNH